MRAKTLRVFGTRRAGWQATRWRGWMCTGSSRDEARRRQTQRLAMPSDFAGTTSTK